MSAAHEHSAGDRGAGAEPGEQPEADRGAGIAPGEQPADEFPEDDEPIEAAPPVVAVMVTHDPGPWFEDSLASLRDQDYPNLVVVVIDAASSEDPTGRVAEVIPGAFVRRLEENAGYGASANMALGIIEGASHFVFCHDDTAADTQAIRLMVEEAFRSNAGVVAPKMVAWDDPSRILSVGMNADKMGALSDRVAPGELDQEQHDAVWDVFVAPGGFTLVRADLFAALGGFDPLIRMFGEDLDLCWRAQVAGARIVVAPAARVRHIEVTRSGTQWRVGIVSSENVRALVRRHELRTVMKCYGIWNLVRVLPQSALASIGEILVCIAAGKFTRARSVYEAWTWNLRSLGQIRNDRHAVQAQRHLPDRDVREYQVSGFARVSSLGRRVIASYHGVHPLSLRGVEGRDLGVGEDLFGEDAASIAEPDPEPAAVPRDTVTGGNGFEGTEPANGDVARSGASPFFSIAGRWDIQAPDWVSAAWVAALVILAIGMRHWVTAGLPVIGQLAHFPSSFSFAHRYIDEGRLAGAGSYSSSPPAFGVLGITGTALFGSTGFLQKILFLGSLPVGALGAYRLARPIGTRIPRLLAMVAYLVVPLPYDLFAAGRLEAVVAFGATPWLLARILGASKVEPFGDSGSVGGRSSKRRSGHAAKRAVGVARRRWSDQDGRRPWLSFGILLALACAFAPGETVILGIVVAGLLLGSLAVGGVGGWARSVLFVAGGGVISAALLFPWLPSMAGPWHGLVPLVGQGGPPWSAPGLPNFIRFDVGFLGAGAAGWAMLLPAALAVVIGTDWRYRWAVRMWGIMVVSWVAAWAGAHGWLGGSTLDTGVMLVPAAIAMSMAIALGACAFAVDLPSHRFGWRQAVSALSAAAMLIASLPVMAAMTAGQLGLPAYGWGQVLGGLDAKAGNLVVTMPAGFAVPASGAVVAANKSSGLTLWIGDPRAIPLGSWPLSPGVAYAVSQGTVPDATYLWPPVDPHLTAKIGAAVIRARQGLTTRLGYDLGELDVAYIVVPVQLSPASPYGPVAPAPWVLQALTSQSDLRRIQVDPSIAYFANAGYAHWAQLSGPSGSASCGNDPAGFPWPGSLACESRRLAPHAPSYRYLEVAAQAALWVLVLMAVSDRAVAEIRLRRSIRT